MNDATTTSSPRVAVGCSITWDPTCVDNSKSLCDELVNQNISEGHNAVHLRYLEIPQKKHIRLNVRSCALDPNVASVTFLRMEYSVHSATLNSGAVATPIAGIVDEQGATCVSPFVLSADVRKGACKHGTESLFENNGSNSHKLQNSQYGVQEDAVTVSFLHFASCFETEKANAAMRKKIESTGAALFRLWPVFCIKYSDGRADAEVGKGGNVTVKSYYAGKRHDYFRVHFRDTKKKAAAQTPVALAEPTSLGGAVAILADCNIKVDCGEKAELRENLRMVMSYLTQLENQEREEQERRTQQHHQLMLQNVVLAPSGSQSLLDPTLLSTADLNELGEQLVLSVGSSWLPNGQGGTATVELGCGAVSEGSDDVDMMSDDEQFGYLDSVLGGPCPSPFVNNLPTDEPDLLNAHMMSCGGSFGAETENPSGCIYRSIKTEDLSEKGAW